MNFILTTIPIRPKPTEYPPVGATSLLDTLIKAGYDPKFYDIDTLRPSFEEVVEFFRQEKPDILGISAVVSTAYRYTKELTHAVKKISPNTKIILGGCLAASSEILLRKCPIDICVIGEGEKILTNLMIYWEKHHDFDPSKEEFRQIKGITFIDKNNDFIFTGYEKQLLPEEMPQPNYELLSKFSDIDHYIMDPLTMHRFVYDKRFYEPHRHGQKCCFIMTGKGCISRCTFCHRWIKGYRSYPMDNIISTMKKMKKKYNVGFFLMGDESFGANPKMIDEFIERVRPLDILFSIGAMRISTVFRNPELVRRLKEVGCVQMIFGMESGSDKILTIMEKGVDRKQNLEVAKLVFKEGMNTCHQLVIGMPGESDKTIKETIECVKLSTEDMHDFSYNRLSINYFQALPGTPAYEFMRSRGLLGKTLDDEEDYLLKVSNIDAGSREHYRNISEECISKVFLWVHRITAETMIHWYKKHGWRTASLTEDFISGCSKNIPRNILIRIWYSFRTKRFYFRLISLLGEPFWLIMLFLMRIRLYGFRKTLIFALGIKREDDRKPFIIKEPKSLRKVVVYPDPKELSISEANVLPLRMGR